MSKKTPKTDPFVAGILSRPEPTTAPTSGSIVGHLRKPKVRVELSYYEQAINRGLSDEICAAIRAIESLLTVVNDEDRKTIKSFLTHFLLHRNPLVWIDGDDILHGEHEGDIGSIGITNVAADKLRAEIVGLRNEIVRLRRSAPTLRVHGYRGGGFQD